MKAVLSLVLICSFGCISAPSVPIAQAEPDIFDSISFKRIPDSWPICIVSVEKDRQVENQWKVTTENGVVYYTNELPQVGDTAFYLKN